MRFLALLLVLSQCGCMVNYYKRPGGPMSITAGFLMNDAMRKLVIDRETKTGKTGVSADGVNLEVDNEALKSVVEGAVKGAIGLP